jgi:alpha-glucosidase
LDTYDAELPSAGWYDLWTGKLANEIEARATPGGSQSELAKAVVPYTVRLHPELATLPVFVRPGAILPMEPLIQSTEEKPKGPLILRVFPGPDCKGQLYQDDGITFAYKRGNFVRMSFTCEVSPDRASLNIQIGKHEGNYPAWWRQILVEVNGMSRKPLSARVDGQTSTFSTGDHSASIVTTDDGNGINVVMRLGTN